jgi:hypothetical protein
LAHWFYAGQQALNIANVMLTRDYFGTRAECQTKLAQIKFTSGISHTNSPAPASR